MQEDEKKSMGHLYFVRHGQTIWNVEGKICGATDIALTELGHEQAIATGKKILEEHIYADEILYSPLMRAADTAKHISEVTGIPARMEQRLKEQNFGKWESTPRNGAEFQVAKQSFVCSYEGGESMLRLAQRIYNLLNATEEDAGLYCLKAYKDDTLVVSVDVNVRVIEPVIMPASGDGSMPVAYAFAALAMGMAALVVLGYKRRHA